MVRQSSAIQKNEIKCALRMFLDSFLSQLLHLKVPLMSGKFKRVRNRHQENEIWGLDAKVCFSVLGLDILVFRCFAMREFPKMLVTGWHLEIIGFCWSGWMFLKGSADHPTTGTGPTQQKIQLIHWSKWTLYNRKIEWHSHFKNKTGLCRKNTFIPFPSWMFQNLHFEEGLVMPFFSGKLPPTKQIPLLLHWSRGSWMVLFRCGTESIRQALGHFFFQMPGGSSEGLQWYTPVTGRGKLTMENGPIEDVFPIEHGDFSWLYVSFRDCITNNGFPSKEFFA